MIPTVMERACTILLESQLEDHFWPEAINISVYLHNRSPTPALNGITPYEAWHGSKLPLEHLRRFGCDAYVYVPLERRKKLDSKSRRCIHLGYVHNTTKLWRVWDPARSRTNHVADVVFDEASFGGRARTSSVHPLSTLLSDAVDYSVTSSAPPLLSTTPITNALPPTYYENVPEVDDTPSGWFTNALENRVGVSNELIPGTRTDNSPMPMEESSVRPITLNGMAPEEGEPVTSHSSAQDGHQSPALHKSKRARKPSFWLRDSVTFARRASEYEEPQSYTEALERPDYRKWEQAIREEFKSHIDNGTWELAELPPGKHDITCKWVFRLKTNADGSTRYRARLVIRGFEQVPGIDFHETFAPVAKFVTVTWIHVPVAVSRAERWISFV